MNFKAQIPNILTLGNLISGLLICIYSGSGDYNFLATLVGLALLFDFLDGTVARLLKVSSAIGKDLDSFADMVSFGVAPALVLYYYWQDQWVFGSSNEWYFILLLLPVFAAYRLAVFNNQKQSGEYFKGLPTPALALCSYSIPLASTYSDGVFDMLNNPFFVVLYAVLGAFIMNSNFKMLSFKVGSKNSTLNKLRILIGVSAILLLWIFSFFGIILCLLMYLIISLTIQKRLKTI